MATDSGKVDTLFETAAPVMFSAMKEKLGLTYQWKAWKQQVVAVKANSTLVCVSKKGETSNKNTFKLDKVTVSEMTNNLATEMERENGIVVHCQTIDDYDTTFRLILSESELASFKEALRMVAKEHNIDEGNRSSITKEVKVKASKKAVTNQSVMRRAVARAMDKYDKRNVKERIMARRGAMKSLPVLFTSDLVHGSWWFVVGSVIFVVTSVMILVNSFDTYIGEDDSTLNVHSYRASWLLMIICGIFCTLGSMAFMRAVHDDPPMKPIFSCYHLQSDELLGSWLFLGANLPIVPYALLYLATSRNDWRYLGALVISFILVLGSSLFILCCYPSEKPRQKLIQPIAYACCCLLVSKDWMRTHLNNDWLAATWLIYWGTCFATFVCFLLFLMAIAENHYLSLYVYGTGLLESAMFLIGAAYFVAGSYPESLSSADLDSAHSKHLPGESMSGTGNNPLNMEMPVNAPMHDDSV